MQPPNDVTATDKWGPRGPQGQQGSSRNGLGGTEHWDWAMCPAPGHRDHPHVPGASGDTLLAPGAPLPSKEGAVAGLGSGTWRGPRQSPHHAGGFTGES